MKNKYIFSITLIICLSFLMSLGAYGRTDSRDSRDSSRDSFRGFTNIGGYSDSRIAFGFEVDETVWYYSGDIVDEDDEPYYYGITTGSSLYIPLYLYPENANDIVRSTEKDVRDNQVSLAWKGKQNESYIDDVTLVDGRREKITGLPDGTYAKVVVNNDYTGQRTATVELDIVLSVRRLTYPETQVTLLMSITNREINIMRSTVYTAHAPTQFYVTTAFKTPGNVTFDFGNSISYTVELTSRDRYFLNLDRSTDPVIAAMYPDSYIEYYNFRGEQDNFRRTGSLNIPIARNRFIPRGSNSTQVYPYEVDGDNLRAMDQGELDFDSRRDVLTIRTASLGYYILSDQPLHKEVDNEEEEIIFVGYAPDVNNEPEDIANAPVTQPNSPAPPPTEQYENVETGGTPIHAANPSADNPLTSDTVTLTPIILSLTLASLIASVAWKKGLFEKKIKQ